MPRKVNHIEQALAILDRMDDNITERGGDDDEHGRRELAPIRRIKDHLRKAEGPSWWAHLETARFTFDAFGHSEYAALMALRKGWEKHRRATGAVGWEEVGMDAHAVPIKGGLCLRDREAL